LCTEKELNAHESSSYSNIYMGIERVNLNVGILI
jgi:hypothetical protein